MKTANFQYPIPNKYHDVVDDINDLRKTFAAMDSDIVEIEEKLQKKRTLLVMLKSALFTALAI